MTQRTIVCLLGENSNKLLVERNARKKQINVTFARTLKQIQMKLPRYGYTLVFRDSVTFLRHPADCFGIHTTYKNDITFLDGDILSVKKADPKSPIVEGVIEKANAVIFNNKLINKLDVFSKDFFDGREQMKLKVGMIKNCPFIPNPKLEMECAELNELNPLQIENEKLPTELPMVSLITPIMTPKDVFFFLNVLMFLKFDYPKELLEWVVIGDNLSEVKKELPPQKDNRIKLVELSAQTLKGNASELTTTALLNAGIQNSNGNVIMHYLTKYVYTPEYIKTGIRALQLVSGIGCKDEPEESLEKSTPFKSRIVKGDTPAIQSLFYYRRIWNARRFSDAAMTNESKPWIKNREEMFACIPWQMSCIKLTLQPLQTKSETALSSMFSPSIKEAIAIIASEV